MIVNFVPDQHELLVTLVEATGRSPGKNILLMTEVLRREFFNTKVHENS